MISTDQLGLLRQELEPIYNSLPKDNGFPSWKSPNCREWSRLALPLARAVLGSNIQRVAYSHDYAHELQGGYGLPEGYHAYLADLSLRDPLVICGTYLQFAFPDSTTHDHILVSIASEVPTILQAAKVDEGAWAYFRPDLHFGKTIKVAP